MDNQVEEVSNQLKAIAEDLLSRLREQECDHPSVSYNDMIRYIITYMMTTSYTRPCDVYEAIGVLEACKSDLAVLNTNKQE